MQIKQILEKKFPDKLDITGEVAEGGTFEVVLPEPDIVLHSKKNGGGYVDTEDKIKAICEGIKKYLKTKSPKASPLARKLLKKQELGHASRRLEAKPEAKLEAKPKAKLEAIPELKPEDEPEVKEPSRTDLSPSPEVEKTTEELVLTKTPNDLDSPTPS
ncbi:uncharacterized protein LOC113453164 [Pseudonaja textilis]|uniref:uncharacterized protein LOC113453157 n=1 Tax=Pseudonaja textilis TaxID=8673 RepID=UPI000EA8D190|nr:uncharacterized protein LOC113453157 [Pseudonaja textilis]XP_026580458.1 uncharacterized protein LOC113453164 [Pseudonaja textilis]